MQLLLLVLVVGFTLAVPPKEKRVHHQRELSDHVHDDAHGFQFDHEAFLGKEDAKTFDQLTPEESQARLGYPTTTLYYIHCKLYSIFTYSVNSA